MKTRKSWKLTSSVAGAILLGVLAPLPAGAQNFTNLIQAQSPLDWWRFDETTPSPAYNTVSNLSTNLASAGAAGTGYVVGQVDLGEPGIVGSSARFTNSGQNALVCLARIDIPNLAALNPYPPFTVEFWAKPTTNGESTDTTGLAAVSSLTVSGTSGLEGPRSGYIFYDGSSGWEFRAGGLDSYTFIVIAPYVTPTNVFTHIVGTFDGTTATLYINGVIAASGPADGGPFKPNNFSPTRIGGTCLPGDEGAQGIGTGNRGWDGWISEFAIYGTVLSSNVVMSHYMAGTNASPGYDALVLASNPLGYWNLEEPAFTAPGITNTIAADSGSLADLGTNTFGTVDDQPGVPGIGDKSVFYNGAAGSLVLDTNVAPPDLSGSDITLAAWIDPLSFGYVSDIIAQGFDTNTLAENYLRVGNTYDWDAWSPAPNTPGGFGNYNPAVVPDVIYYEVGAYDGSGPGYISAVFPAPAGDLGHWVFLVGTYDGTNWNLYRNGQLVNQFSGAFPDGSGSGPTLVQNASSANDPWSVGSASDPNQFFGMFFDGYIAEPAIFATALDAATISNLYNSVTLPPVITEAPVAPSPAYVGSSATLSVWADGPGTLTYQWYTNNAALAGQTATNLALSNLTAAADATYSVVVRNANGSVTSSVVIEVLPLPPVTAVPATESRWIGSPLSFTAVGIDTNEQFSFQWDLNGHVIAGATESTYAATTLPSGSVGSYTLVLSNSAVVLTSSVATFTAALVAPNLYVSNVLADHPLSYFRLDESNGPIAYDYAGGDNGTYVGTLIKLGVPGYSLIDTDTAALFPGVATNYVGDFGATAINFDGTNAEFTIEAWANGPANQIGTIGTTTGAAVIAKGNGGNGTEADEQFAIAVTSGNYEFFVRDSKENIVAATASTGPDGNWHHLVGVCDYQGLGGNGPGLTFYIDGTNAATAGLPGALIASGIVSSQDAVSIGSESSGPGPTFDLAYNGTIDEVAIYPTNLSATQVSNHFEAAYGPDLAPFIVSPPVSVTNYITLPASLAVAAAGSTPLSYQWNQNGSPVPGASDNHLVISNLAYANAGTYTVGITNKLTGGVVTGILSAPVTITVLAPPTTPPSIPDLVMHLTFDNTLVDATGRGNDATNEASGGAPLITNDYVAGQIGEAFTYQTTVNAGPGGTTNANYASVGVRPDLQFGTNSFTVSMWVQMQPNELIGDLPFFCDVIGSTFSFPGYCFDPGFTNGGWAFSVEGLTGNGLGEYGAANSINDGFWHSLVYVMDRSGAGVYLDGVLASFSVVNGAGIPVSTTLAAAGNINSPNPAIIGQDPTGLYAEAGSANIDDLGVWTRALTPLEAASIYMAGISNQLSFTGTGPSTFTLQTLPGTNGPQLELNWSSGTLQSATNLTGPWTNVPGATPPYTNKPTGPAQYFRVKF